MKKKHAAAYAFIRFLLVLMGAFLTQPWAFAESVSLTGVWEFQLDPDDTGREQGWFSKPLAQKIQLPGSLQAQGFGEKISPQTTWEAGVHDRSWYSHPRYEKYRQPDNIKIPFWLQADYLWRNPAWYAREIAIPESWRGKRVTLSLERVHWFSEAWLNGKPLGKRDSLGTPHVYTLEGVEPGRHRLVLRIDNRRHINVGREASSITDHTQTNWNGAIGALTLDATDPVWVDNVQIFPDAARREAKVKLKIGNATGVAAQAAVSFALTGPDGTASVVPVARQVSLTAAPVTEIETTIPLGETLRLWDEFHPNLYALQTTVTTTGDVPAKHVSTERFGVREITAKDGTFLLNGKPVFLRGTLECCIFPLTGYPAMDRAYWQKIYQACRAHGLNHVRFHSWCPPKAAFEVADEMGFYLQVEAGLWTTVGAGQPIDQWLYAETRRIFDTYGNHPSMVLFTHGNEPGGVQARNRFLAKYVQDIRAWDARRLYTAGAHYPILRESDFHNPGETDGFFLRARFRLNEKPATVFNYAGQTKKHRQPAVAHEIGQWCVFPDFDEIPKYKGFLKARNFEIVQDFLVEKGMAHQAKDFLIASGKFQTLQYKEEIESMLRTTPNGGFQLLDLHDFPGQGTALVGVLDAFWEGKGYVTPEEYRRFCGPVTPLAELEKFTWTTGETLTATVKLSQFGPETLQDVTPRWTLMDSRTSTVVAQGELPVASVSTGTLATLGQIRVPLGQVAAPAQLKLEILLPGTDVVNDWPIWVYPETLETSTPSGVVETTDWPTVQEALQAGKTVLFLPARNQIPAQNNRPVTFASIFWNMAWFPGQAAYLGYLIDSAHPALAGFPTETHTNWQWWELAVNARPLDLDTLPRDFFPIVQVIDDWNQCRKLGVLFEAQVGRGKLLVCTLDIQQRLEERVVARQLRHSLLRYMTGGTFQPKQQLSLDAVGGLLKTPPAVLAKLERISSNSKEAGFGPENIFDGDPGTLWHTAWKGKTSPPPYHVTLSFKKVEHLSGLRILPRSDMDNGRIAEFSVQTATTPEGPWREVMRGTWPNNTEWKTVNFPVPVKTQYLRIVAEKEVYNRAMASLAEVELTFAE